MDMELDDGVYSFTARVESAPGVVSDPSNSVTIVIDATPPLPPSNVGATPGNSLVILTWEASPSSDTLGYNVWRKVENAPDSTYSQINVPFPVVNTRFCDATVTNGTTYVYRVTAVDDARNEAGP